MRSTVHPLAKVPRGELDDRAEAMSSSSSSNNTIEIGTEETNGDGGGIRGGKARISIGQWNKILQG